MDPEDLIVDSLAFRIRVQPRLKVLPGESPDAPPTMELRLQSFLELRPVFRTPRPRPTPTTTTTTTRPYDRRRRGHIDAPPPDVLKWCDKNLRGVPCGIVLRVLVNPLWSCVRCCPVVPRCRDCLFPCPVASHLLSNSSDSEGSPSISYQVNRLPGVDLAPPGELSELEWFAESPEWPENLTLPAGFLFDTPDLRNLLSTAERQRVQDFKETVDEETVPPGNVWVTDGDCPVPFAIGGGCKCKEGCSRWHYMDPRIRVLSDTRVSCFQSQYWPTPVGLVALHKTICGPRRVHEAYGSGKTLQLGGIFARCEVGTLIGGACSRTVPYDRAEILAAFPEDQNMFRCLGTGQWSEKAFQETLAIGYCLELEGNEKVIMVRREGRDSASVQCPDGYQVVGGGCTFIEGTEFLLHESYPTSRNTWECVFDSTQSCGEGSADVERERCARSKAEETIVAFLTTMTRQWRQLQSAHRPLRAWGPLDLQRTIIAELRRLLGAMNETATSSFIPEGDVTRDYICDTLRNWAEAAPHWQHILEIEIDTKTNICNDVYFIDDAKIPAITLPKEDEAAKTEETSEGKQLTVEMLSGQVVQIKVPAPYTVAQVKQCLEPRLGIPAFLQGIIAGAEELPDEAVVTGDAVAFLQREPPMIEAEDFLRSMVDMSWDPADIFRRWHKFDTYNEFPRLQSELLEWALTHRNMQNAPLSTDQAGAHPEGFKEYVEKITAFMRHCCYSPSLLVVYNEPYGHDDDLEHVFFFVGRLRNEPQTFVVQSFLFNCWI
ncbi:unnamed protein product [Symbiodinium sp. KB8]|nr:unnamed protein product [Symbiodinium sp. KB8]